MRPPLTVACVWVQGNVPYDVDYVVKLESMVRRHLARPFYFVCLTDRPNRIRQADPAGHIDTIEVPSPGGLYGWWSKLQLFNPKAAQFYACDYRNGGQRGRVLYLDLDTVVVDELDGVVDFPAHFALVPPGGNFQPRDGRVVVRRFNSSVMVWDAGTQAALYTSWSHAVAARLWGDQDWIGERAPDAATMPAEWFPRLSECLEGIPPGAKVVLCKKPKNSEAARRLPWVREAWA